MTDFRDARLRDAAPHTRGFDRLTPLDEARKAILTQCRPVRSTAMPLDKAFGLIAAEAVLTPRAMPGQALALRDGFAVAALDTLGASAYAPALSLSPPQWVNCGEPLPPGTDAVLPAHAVQENTLPVEILMQAAPGDGVRWQGGDLEAGRAILETGEAIRPVHLALLRAAGLDSVNVRSPRLVILVRSDLPQGDFIGPALAAHAKTLGAAAHITSTRMNDIAAFSQTLENIEADMAICIGGTGFGADDHAAAALRQAGTLLVHGLAMRPAETVACGFIPKTSSSCPVLCAPGRLEAAFAIWFSLAKPCLQILTAMKPDATAAYPLARKIVSAPGLSENVLLRRTTIDAKIMWEPLGTGDLPWHALARAEAWHIVPPESEGYPAGAILDAEEI